MRGVTITSAADAGLCPSSRWYCSCDRHNTLLGASTKRAAQSAARNPAEWCDECRDEASNASDDPNFGTLERCRAHRERVRAVRPGRFHIIATQPGTAAYGFGVRFALVPDDERADYEACGAVFVDNDSEAA